MTIDLEDYTGLAWFYAQKYNNNNSGVELDDLYQAAMIGIWTATKTYDKESSSFTTYAKPFIDREIIDLIYKQVQIGGVRQRILRIREELLDDITEGEDNSYTDNFYSDSTVDDICLEQFIDLLEIDQAYKKYFIDMVNNGIKQATKDFMLEYNCTRQNANRVKKRIIDRVKEIRGTEQ